MAVKNNDMKTKYKSKASELRKTFKCIMLSIFFFGLGILTMVLIFGTAKA